MLLWCPHDVVIGFLHSSLTSIKSVQDGPYRSTIDLQVPRYSVESDAEVSRRASGGEKARKL